VNLPGNTEQIEIDLSPLRSSDAISVLMLGTYGHLPLVGSAVGWIAQLGHALSAATLSVVVGLVVPPLKERAARLLPSAWRGRTRAAPTHEEQSSRRHPKP